MNSVINFQRERNNFYRDSEVIHLLPASNSLVSPYIPFMSGFTGTVIQNNIGDRVLIYDTLVAPIGNRGIHRYNDLFRVLRDAPTPRLFNTGSLILNATKGALYEVNPGTNEVNFHIILAVESSSFFSMNRDAPDKSKFVLLIENRFSMSPTYTNIYSRLQREWFPLHRDEGIDILYTNSIKDKCFRTVPPPSFKTLAEKKGYLSNLNDKILYEET